MRERTCASNCCHGCQKVRCRFFFSLGGVPSSHVLPTHRLLFVRCRLTATVLRGGRRLQQPGGSIFTGDFRHSDLWLGVAGQHHDPLPKPRERPQQRQRRVCERLHDFPQPSWACLTRWRAAEPDAPGCWRRRTHVAPVRLVVCAHVVVCCRSLRLYPAPVFISCPENFFFQSFFFWAERRRGRTMWRTRWRWPRSGSTN